MDFEIPEFEEDFQEMEYDIRRKESRKNMLARVKANWRVPNLSGVDYVTINSYGLGLSGEGRSSLEVPARVFRDLDYNEIAFMAFQEFVSMRRGGVEFGRVLDITKKVYQEVISFMYDRDLIKQDESRKGVPDSYMRASPTEEVL